MIDAACAIHDHFRIDPLPADPYGGAPGYINPIPASPSEAEKLYIQLYRYTGQNLRPDTCGCHINMCVDRFGGEPVKIQAHPKHTRKCSHHAGDDDVHTAALENLNRKNSAINALKARFAQLTDDDIQWAFDDRTRLLRVRSARLTAGQKVQAQADHNPLKVVIE